MATTVKNLLSAANSSVPKLSPQDAADRLQEQNVLVVDVRDPSEVEKTGKLKGAVNVSRGMLEFRADPESQYHNPAFQKDKTVLVYCASGGRSALAGKTLQDMGYGQLYNLGAFKDLADAGNQIEPATSAS
ncbi:rhodanese-like domain-containing protein [Micromonospora sp. STR1s_5]|nr:rhodanese-like domain-containing protein [Micromonospora sp. STR1s_5]